MLKSVVGPVFLSLLLSASALAQEAVAIVEGSDYGGGGGGSTNDYSYVGTPDTGGAVSPWPGSDQPSGPNIEYSTSNGSPGSSVPRYNELPSGGNAAQNNSGSGGGGSGGGIGIPGGTTVADLSPGDGFSEVEGQTAPRRRNLGIDPDKEAYAKETARWMAETLGSQKKATESAMQTMLSSDEVAAMEARVRRDAFRAKVEESERIARDIMVLEGSINKAHNEIVDLQQREERRREALGTVRRFFDRSPEVYFNELAGAERKKAELERQLSDKKADFGRVLAELAGG
jgi:hypothetical protein